MTPMKLIKQALQVADLGFDDQQKAAISHRGAPLLLTGGAGSGKTTVLIEAAISRIAEGADSDSILFITFGRETASAIRDAIAIASSARI